ncbi:Multi antimicrobial extrusion protein [Prunus yedoensis var. nudiflora]|uniref:Protein DETOXIFICATION n=1 Tax=Prunus yedoensis var. nudiflora TaxID=2094558 RepID=A0A314ZB92_PRUYE|nr:Multi antimicrobial extrusion protein [Prunus yedoensis var. nudiflora]
MYAKCGEIRDARKMFDDIPHKNVVSWSGMIYGYAQVGEDEEALRLFKQALVQNLDVNDFTFSSVIRVCGNSTLLELGKQIHSLCFKTNFNLSSFVGSSLVSLYSKCGVIEGAYRVFDEIPVKNLGMWNAMLIACAQHVHTDKALDLFKQMGSAGMKPNFITFLCVLYACSHAGLVEKGQYYFALMKDYEIEPGEQHYASLVDLLGRAGKLAEAVKIIEEMPIEPTESIWGALLTGCRIHGDTELAASVADRVFELGPVSSGLHVLMSNAYAAAGRFEEAAKARKMLRDRGMKKETGLSWVEEGNKIHTFAAGDRRHMRTKEIYLKLEELGEEMEKAGYVADTSFVLREVNREEKDQTIRYHSERLAIAFGLITFPPDRPIRIMKNLRICGDCHTAIKFMSKCSGRVIIVRDNNRFHRFEDGKCTCGDYWKASTDSAFKTLDWTLALLLDKSTFTKNVFKADELGLEIVHIALPTLLALLADPVASLVDTAFVGHIGPVELAAVGISIAVFNQVSKIAIFPLVSITTSFVAEEDTTEELRANEQVHENVESGKSSSTEMVKIERVRRHIPSASSALVVGSVLGVIQAVFLIFAANPVLNYMGVDSNSPMLKPARQYLTLRSLGAPAVLLSLAVQGVFRGFKDTKTPLYATIAGDVANIILDPILMFVFHMGVRGAAIAHVISQ